MIREQSKILSNFQGILRLAVAATVLLALGFPVTAMATSEHSGGLWPGRRADRGSLEITLGHPREIATSFAKSVLAVSLFRHFDDWNEDEWDDDHGQRGREHRFAALLGPFFSAHWKDRDDRIPPIPEPGTGLLLAMGLVALGSRRRR